MIEIPTLLTEGLDGVTVSDSGQHAVFKLKAAPDPVHIAVRTEKLLELMIAASNASAAAMRTLKNDPTTKHTFPVEAWEIGRTADGNHLVLSFRMPGGMEMSFQFDRELAAQYSQALASAASSMPGAQAQ